jgi:hypothetical protein
VRPSRPSSANVAGARAGGACADDAGEQREPAQRGIHLELELHVGAIVQHHSGGAAHDQQQHHRLEQPYRHDRRHRRPAATTMAASAASRRPPAESAARRPRSGRSSSRSVAVPASPKSSRPMSRAPQRGQRWQRIGAQSS